MEVLKDCTLFLCGDVMIGRGIDQIMPHHVDPQIFESYMQNAKGYVELAERKNGPIPRSVEAAYIWGDALKELERVQPDARIINLETSLTTSDAWQPKGINYRSHPQNISVLEAAKVDVCSLANNHVLDWGVQGLHQTLSVLHQAGIKSVGAGVDLSSAQTPAVIHRGDRGRIIVFSMATSSSGVPESWGAGDKPGVYLLSDLSSKTVFHLKEQIEKIKKPKDLVVLSIHWGGNWGYEIPTDHREFARTVIAQVGVDVVHGHSSHHVLGVEVYQGKLIIYGCGDFITDYEGIGGYEEYRGDLSLMFFPSVDVNSGKLIELRLVPLHLKKFRLERATLSEAQWLRKVLNREGERLGTSFTINSDHSLQLRFSLLEIEIDKARKANTFW